MRYYIIIAFLCVSLITCTNWQTSSELQCGNYWLIKGSYSNTRYVSSPTSYQYNVTFISAFSSIPYVALSTVGLQAPPTIISWSHRNNIQGFSSITTTYYIGNVAFTVDQNGYITNKISYLAVNQNIFPSISIDWANYSCKINFLFSY